MSIKIYKGQTKDMSKGLFISFEGPDGSGKTTQIKLLSEYLEAKGTECVLTREPGGTRVSEEIRGILLDRANAGMSYTAEALLYAAARAQLVAEVIKPALNEGKAVLCDRFVDSSAVYQGMARGLGVEEIYTLNEFALDGIRPELTIHLDLSAEEGLRRKTKQAELDRMESEPDSFHRLVAEGYRELAKLEPERIKTIDASLPVEEIQEMIRGFVDGLR